MEKPIKTENEIEIEKMIQTYEDRQIFIEGIFNPPSANDKLKKAQITHSNLIKNEQLNTNKMTLKEQINADFITAFKAKEMTKKNFLGLLKGEIQTSELRGIESTDENVLVILKKMEKSLNQTNTYEAALELEYLKPYLPQMMSESEIITIIKDLKDNGMTSIGQIMGVFNKEYKGKADNQLVSKLIKSIEEEKRTVTGIYIQVNHSEMFNIQDLSVEEYESFLETMQELIFLYKVISEKKHKI